MPIFHDRTERAPSTSAPQMYLTYRSPPHPGVPNVKYYAHIKYDKHQNTSNITLVFDLFNLHLRALGLSSSS